MRSSRIATAYLFAALAWSCQGPSSAQDETIEDTYEVSTVVALVRVVEGQRVKVETNWCGSAFTADVVNAVKGVGNGEVLRFSVAAPVTIGGFYLVFLTSRDAFNVHDSLSAYRSPLAPGCEAMLPPLVPTYEFALVRGTEPRSLEQPSLGLYFDALWDLPPQVPMRIVGYESDYGEVIVKRVDTAAMLAFLKSLRGQTL